MKILSNILVKAGILVEGDVTVNNLTATAYVVANTVWVNGSFKNNNNGNMSLAFNGSTVSITTDAGNVINAFGTGNVAIGSTTDSGQKFQVYGSTLLSGDLTVTNANNATINLGLIQKLTADSGTGVYKFWNGSGGGWSFQWYNNGSTAMTLSTANNLLVGTTTDAGYKIDAVGEIRASSRLVTGLGGIVNNCLTTHITNHCGSSGFITFGFSNVTNPSLGDSIFDIYQGNPATPVYPLFNFKHTLADTTGGSTALSIISLTTTINQSNSSNGIVRGFYYNPTVTNINGTHYAYESTSGKFKISDLAGSETRMVVADSSGVLTTQAIPSGGTSASTRTIQKFTSTANQTTFTITGGYTVGMVDVWLNGVKLDNATDFTATNGSTVVLTDALASGQTVEVYKYGSQFIVNNGLRQTTLFSATAGQTTFTVGYSVGLVDVFYNGSKLDSSEYTATNGTSIVFNTACAVNDKVEVVAYNYNVGAFTGVGGSGTTNYIPKWTASGTLGNSLLSDDGSKITISTGNTSLLLDTTSAIYDASLRFNNNNSATSWAIMQAGPAAVSGGGLNTYTTGAYPMIFGTNSTERLRITSSGTIAIGGNTITDSNLLNLIGNQSSVNVGIVFNNTNATFPKIYGIQNINNGLTFYDYSANAARMTLTSAGNFGIGTSSPSVALHVANSANSTTAIFENTGGTTQFIGMKSTSGSVYIGNVQANMYFEAGGAERMRINTSGKLLIGTTTGVQSPTVKLETYQTNDQHGIVSIIAAGNGNAAFMGRIDASTSNYFGAFLYNGSWIGTINTTSGTSVNYNTTFSDVRKKKNFESWNENVSSLFRTLNPQQYHLIGQSNNEQKIKGFIAQELSDKFPEAYPKDHEGFYSFNPSGMVVYLMKAVQEEEQRMDAQELRIQQLEQEVITLKSQLGSN